MPLSIKCKKKKLSQHSNINRFKSHIGEDLQEDSSRDDCIILMLLRETGPMLTQNSQAEPQPAAQSRALS